MSDALIPSLVPPGAVSATTLRWAETSGAPLVAELTAPPHVSPLVFAMAGVDADGRVQDRSVVAALGWRAGHRLQMQVIGGSVLVYRDRAGVFAMGGRPYLVLPAAVRRRCALAPRERVLLVADPRHALLVVHPRAAVGAMVAAYHAGLVGGERDDHASR
jgi:hypothetical protein